MLYGLDNIVFVLVCAVAVVVIGAFATGYIIVGVGEIFDWMYKIFRKIKPRNR
jgi:hypothetical protein